MRRDFHKVINSVACGLVQQELRASEFVWFQCVAITLIGLA
jgi:hypothetical protein